MPTGAERSHCRDGPGTSGQADRQARRCDAASVDSGRGVHRGPSQRRPRPDRHQHCARLSRRVEERHQPPRCQPRPHEGVADRQSRRWTTGFATCGLLGSPTDDLRRHSPSYAPRWPGRSARDGSRSTLPGRFGAPAPRRAGPAGPTADPVLLPSWKELADLAAFPRLREDRLLILTIAWAGLRWSEAISLSVTDLWPSRARLSVRRVFSWDQDEHEWVIEAVKAGLAATVPLPAPLWAAAT